MQEEIRKVFDIKGGFILAGLFLFLFLMQSVRELRHPTQPVMKRTIKNFLLSIPSFLLLRWAFLPFMVWIAVQNQQWQAGVMYLINQHPIMECLAVLLFLDYSNYFWHILNHKVPLLWRFHIVHHCDVDLDLSTAIRFHFGEMIGSLIFRGLFVLLSGATPFQVILFEIIFEAATQFHHSNWKLPFKFEKLLNFMIVTPRMHGIHHSVIKQETDSNYAVIFSFWDRIHQTIRLNISHSKIITGVPSYHESKEQSLIFLLKLPFKKIRPWTASLRTRQDGTSDEKRGVLKR